MLPALDMPSQGILGQAAKYRTLSELLGSMSLHRGAAGVGVTGAGLSRAPRGHLRRILPGQRCAAVLHILSGRRSLACGPRRPTTGSRSGLGGGGCYRAANTRRSRRRRAQWATQACQVSVVHTLPHTACTIAVRSARCTRLEAHWSW